MLESREPDQRSGAEDSEALARELELELMRQRVTWQKTSSRRGTWRALSILFLLLLLLAGFFGYFYLLPQIRDRAEKQPATRTEHSR